MMILLQLIFITFLCVMALKISMAEGMIFSKLGSYFERKVNEGHKIFELFICQWCAATLQSITAHAFAFGLGILPLEFNWQLLIRWPLVIFGASFLSGNVWNLYQTINAVKERNEAETEYFERCNAHDEIQNYEHNHN